MDFRKTVEGLGKTATRALGKLRETRIHYDSDWERPANMNIPVLLGYSEGITPKAEVIDLADTYLFIGGIDEYTKGDVIWSIADAVISNPNAHLCVSDQSLNFIDFKERAIVANEPLHQLKMLRGIKLIIDRRNAGEPADLFHRPWIVLLLEEAGDMFLSGSVSEEDDEEMAATKAELVECKDILTHLIDTGKNAGLSIVACSRHNPALIARLISKFDSKLALLSTETASQKIIGEAFSQEKPLERGEVILRTNDRLCRLIPPSHTAKK